MSNSGNPVATPSLGRHMLHGSAWMIGVRWAVRLTGLVSTIVLARLLSPADYGIVAMAMIVVSLLEVLSPSGQKLALIRLADPDREHYDTVWTMSVIVGVVIGALILAIAPLTVFYFRDGRAIPVMQWLALRSVIGGFENVGVLDFRRELRFDRVFVYNVAPKLVSFVATIAAAVWLRNYWALVVGMLVFSFASTGLSFAMHSYRPRFSLAKLGELLSFSFWTLLRSVGWSLNFQVDQLVIGGFSGAAAMGRYSVASDLASSPSREVNDPMVAVLYPVMATVQHDKKRLRQLYLRVLGWSVVICASTSVGVTVVAHDLVWAVLGPKWHDVEPLMGWLALSAGLLGLSSGAYTTFDALGRPDIGARMQWLRLLMLCVAIIPLGFAWHDLRLIAEGRLLVTLVFLPTLFLAVGYVIGVSWWDYCCTCWRPLAASALMAASVLALEAALGSHKPVEGLLLESAAGAIVFTASSLGLWVLSGRPHAPERDVMEFVTARWRRAKAEKQPVLEST